MTQEFTPLKKALDSYEASIKGQFKPNRVFYKSVGINQKRFGLLLRGQLEMTISEVKSLSVFFKVPETYFLN